MVPPKQHPASINNVNGSTRPNSDLPNMSFSKKDAAEARQQNGNGFRTDSAISGNRQQGERVLQRWVPDENIPVNMSLESSSKQSGGWDQFAVNERLFGLKTDYDETIYTTAIDKSHPEYSKRYAAADRKAREIENSVANNRHVEEERVADNLTVDDSGLDEEDKYSGVQRQDFPPLSVTGRPGRYTPPARRAPSGKATVSGAPVDPAIISSQLARPGSEAPSTSAAKPEHAPKAGGPEVSTPPTTTESSFAVTPEPKATPTNTSTSASGTASPHPKVTSTPNATATVERDVVTAFRGFAAQQRTQADKLRLSKQKADKEEKLQELKAFASSFKLHSPLPNDLVAIIAKDPAKQRAIQENARRQAEEVQQEKQMKADAVQVPRSGLPTSDQRTTQRSGAGAGAGTVSASATSNRQAPGRGGYPPQGPYHNQPFRQDRSTRSQISSSQQAHPTPPLSTRLKNIEQSKNGLAPPGPGVDTRQPPTGPAHGPDTSASRRTSATALLGKLNPNSHEFRPSPFAAAFNPNGNPSNASSPRSASATASQGIPSASGSFLRRKPATPSKAKADGPVLDIIERLAQEKPPQGRDWSSNGGIKPAYDTPPTWRQVKDDEPPSSTMNLTYAKLFENARFSGQPMSPQQPSSAHPQVAHQHQLPFHLQQGAHNTQRPSPRQPPLHMHNNQSMQQNPQFHSNDDHRMVPSHSAQSYASPRLAQVNVAYPSPMGQPAQLSFQQPGMQYPVGPGGPQMAQFRSYSGGHQFMPQQPTHMGGPVMIQGPAGSFIGNPNLMTPGPPMLYPVNQAHFAPQGNGPPPPMAGSNGYPSPGRSAPMMMPGGSQQGQQYGMSPGMQYGQPIYAQQPPGQMPNMRVYPPQGQQFGTSPQMPQYSQPQRGGPNGSFNKGYHQHNGPHPQAQQSQAPTGPQRPATDGEEAR